MKPKILVVVGPTASGKSDLAVRLAKKLNGEVVSADSRQVYKGLNIGTGKITKKEMKGVRHHLLDVFSTQKRFTADIFQKMAYQAIDEILARGKLPIICGGSGFYIQSIMDGIKYPNVDPQPSLRKKLNKLSAKKLFAKLKKLDPSKTDSIDRNNRVRLIRAIEIATVIGRNQRLEKNPRYESLQIGIKISLPMLKIKIEKRLMKRLRMGMIKEAERLHKKGLSWKRMDELGLEYRYLALFSQKKITKEEMIESLKTKIFQYAKRQMTWFRKDKRIYWITHQ